LYSQPDTAHCIATQQSHAAATRNCLDTKIRAMRGESRKRNPLLVWLAQFETLTLKNVQILRHKLVTTLIVLLVPVAFSLGLYGVYAALPKSTFDDAVVDLHKCSTFNVYGQVGCHAAVASPRRSSRCRGLCHRSYPRPCAGRLAYKDCAQAAEPNAARVCVLVCSASSTTTTASRWRTRL
jgi:hypothetical protein